MPWEVKTEHAVITMLKDMTQRQITGVQCSVCEGRDLEQELLFVMVCVQLFRP